MLSQKNDPQTPLYLLLQFTLSVNSMQKTPTKHSMVQNLFQANEKNNLSVPIPYLKQPEHTKCRLQTIE